MLCMDTLQFSKYRSNAIPILSLILRNECPINMPPAAYLVYGVWHLRGGEGRTNIENGSIVYMVSTSFHLPNWRDIIFEETTLKTDQMT